ncbi:MAG: SulP family inorganic anion transporter [Fluviibacter sp.]
MSEADIAGSIRPEIPISGKTSGKFKVARFRPKLLDTLKDYTPELLAKDMAAGVTVGVLALPLAIAFAIASGCSPTAGIWTAIIAGFVISLLGGSRVQIGGPTGAFIPIVFGIVSIYGFQNLMVATMIAGILLFLMGLTRMGALIRFIPISVVIGFTNGIAVVIFLSQIKDFFGLNTPAMPAEFFSRMEMLAQYAHTLQVPTVIMSATCLITLILWNQRAAAWIPALGKIPGPLALLIAATALQAVFAFPVETIGSRFGGIPRDIPPLSLPTLSLATLNQLIQPAIAIALLGAIESLLSARVADAAIDDRHDPNQELMAQGIANLVAPLFGGFAATGAIARTSTNVRAGGRSPIAGITHALTLLLVVVVAAPAAVYVPLPALSAILMLVAWNMGEWHAFKELRRYTIPYRSILVSTFVITVVFDLTLAVELGMILACLFYLYRMSELTQVERIPLEDYYGSGALSTGSGQQRIFAYRIYGSLFFAAISKLESLLDEQDGPANVVILDMTKTVSLDTTGLDLLQTLQRSLNRHEGHLILCGLNEQPASLVERSGFAEALGPRGVSRSLTDALLRAQLIVQTHPL